MSGSLKKIKACSNCKESPWPSYELVDGLCRVCVASLKIYYEKQVELVVLARPDQVNHTF